MCEPLSIITGVASLVAVCVKISQSLTTLKGKYYFADLSITSLVVECSNTGLGLSQLQSALQSRPDILDTQGYSRDDVVNNFNMAIWGVAAVFSLLDAELKRLESGSMETSTWMGFRKKSRYLWNEDRLKELAQQIREQRSSISFLLQMVNL
jgi:hypothetical protein